MELGRNLFALCVFWPTFWRLLRPRNSLGLRPCLDDCVLNVTDLTVLKFFRKVYYYCFITASFRMEYESFHLSKLESIVQSGRKTSVSSFFWSVIHNSLAFWIHHESHFFLT